MRELAVWPDVQGLSRGLFLELSSHLGAALRTGRTEKAMSQTFLPLALPIAGPEGRRGGPCCVAGFLPAGSGQQSGCRWPE